VGVECPVWAALLLIVWQVPVWMSQPAWEHFDGITRGTASTNKDGHPAWLLGEDAALGYGGITFGGHGGEDPVALWGCYGSACVCGRNRGRVQYVMPLPYMGILITAMSGQREHSGCATLLRGDLPAR